MSSLPSLGKGAFCILCSAGIALGITYAIPSPLVSSALRCEQALLWTFGGVWVCPSDFLYVRGLTHSHAERTAAYVSPAPIFSWSVCVGRAVVVAALPAAHQALPLPLFSHSAAQAAGLPLLPSLCSHRESPSIGSRARPIGMQRTLQRRGVLFHPLWDLRPLLALSSTLSAVT
jgi:hypothetical protein